MPVIVYPDCPCCMPESGSGSGCAIPGWRGPGWYCILFAGECIHVELLVEDECNDLITICSGPYATEALALAACTPVDILITCCDPDIVVGNAIKVTPSDGSGVFFLLWNGSQWSGRHLFACGRWVAIRILPSLACSSFTSACIIGNTENGSEGPGTTNGMTLNCATRIGTGTAQLSIDTVCAGQCANVALTFDFEP